MTLRSLLRALVPRDRNSLARAFITLLLMALVGTAVLPVWNSQPLPLQDVPNHLAKVDLLVRLTRHDEEACRIFAVNFRPVPNLTSYLVLLSMAPFLSLETATRILLTVALVGLAVGGYLLQRQLNRENLVLVLLTPGLAYTSFMSKGYLNFVVALPLYMLGLLFLSSTPLTRGRWIGFCILGLGLYLTHGFVFLAFCGTLAGFLVLRRPGLGWAMRAITALLPSVLLLTVWLLGGAHGTPEGLKLAFPPLQDRFWDVTPLLFGSEYKSVAGLCWLAAVTLVGAYSLYTSLASLVRDRDFSVFSRQPFLFLGATMLLLYFFSPETADSLLTPDSRMTTISRRWLPLSILTALPSLLLPRIKGVRNALGACWFLAALALNFQNLWSWQQDSSLVREYKSGIEAFESGSSLLPVYFGDPESSYLLNLHSWAYYHLAKGGWGPYLHAWPKQHPVVYRRLPWAPPEIATDVLNDDLVRKAADCYDYLLLWNSPATSPAVLSQDFRLRFQTTRLELWRNRRPVSHSSRSASSCWLATL